MFLFGQQRNKSDETHVQHNTFHLSPDLCEINFDQHFDQTEHKFI